MALLCATLIWGSAFIAQSTGMDHIQPFTFQAVRCGIAVPFLALLVWIFDRKNGNWFKKWADPKLWKVGILCGSALFLAAGLQQVGLVTTTAGKAGFFTAMYIVLVPILGLFLGKRPPLTAWISVIVAVAGLYLLSGAGSGGWNVGDLCLMLCALAFSVQITLIDTLGQELDSLRLNCVQSLVCSILSAVVMFFWEDPQPGAIVDCWKELCYTGILSTGVAYSLQIIGQKHLPSTPASLIMSLESVFAALFGWAILKETMADPEIWGCCLVFSGVLLSQIPSKE